MRLSQRPALLSLLAVGVLTVVGVAAVAPVGLGSAAPAAIPPIAQPAQVGPSNVLDGMLQTERRRFDCIDRVNAERSQRGLGLVAYDVRLAQAASAHSIVQADRKRMGHDGLNDSRGGQRITAAGYTWNVWAENVAFGQTNCASVMTDWMNSTSHRANILDPRLVHIGVGLALDTDGRYYWTMKLAVGG